MNRTDITVHGFRATFRTWADEETSFSNQAVEFCLSHVPGDEAEKAYRRRSMFAKRKQIMWATPNNPRGAIFYMKLPIGEKFA